MKRIVHPPVSKEDLEKHLAKKREEGRSEQVKDVHIDQISVDSLLGDGLLGLYREMKNLLFLSSKGKLSPPEAKDLRDTVKLLFELKDREKSLLEGLETEKILETLEVDSDNQNSP